MFQGPYSNHACPHEQEDISALLIPHVLDAAFAIDENGEILRASKEAERLFRFNSSELMHQSIRTLIPDISQGTHAEQRISRSSRGALHHGFRKDGKKFPINVIFSSFQTATKRLTIAIVCPATKTRVTGSTLRKATTSPKPTAPTETLQTERTVAQQSFKIRSRQHDALVTLVRKTLEEHSLGQIFDEAVCALRAGLPVDFCEILELSQNDSHFLHRVEQGKGTVLAPERRTKISINSQAGFTLRHNEPVIIKDARKETRFKMTSLQRKQGVISGASVMIQGRGIPYGVLEVHTRKPHIFLKDDILFLENVAAILASAIEQTRLKEELLHICNMEQVRIGQDLHDGLGQYLAAIEFRSTALMEQLKGDPISEKEAAQIAKLTREATKQARLLAGGLFQQRMDSVGLISALRQLADTTSRLFEVSCSFRCAGSIPILDEKTALHLYRIAQEAVSNAVRHGNSTSIQISFKTYRNKIILQILDNGDGLHDSSTAWKGSRIGLRTMRYRAEMVGAMFRVSPAKSRGTEVVCVLKLIR